MGGLDGVPLLLAVGFGSGGRDDGAAALVCGRCWMVRVCLFSFYCIFLNIFGLFCLFVYLVCWMWVFFFFFFFNILLMFFCGPLFWLSFVSISIFLIACSVLLFLFFGVAFVLVLVLVILFFKFFGVFVFWCGAWMFVLDLVIWRCLVI